MTPPRHVQELLRARWFGCSTVVQWLLISSATRRFDLYPLISDVKENAGFLKADGMTIASYSVGREFDYGCPSQDVRWARAAMTMHRSNLSSLFPMRAFNSVGGAETLTDSVRNALRRDILSLVFSPGTHLSIRAMRERYDVGATPVREALWSLVGEGLIVSEAQYGFRVSHADRERLIGLMQLRRRMEPWLLAAALRRNEAEWRQNLEMSFAAFAPVDSKIGDLRPIDEQWETLHRRFHIALIAGSGMSSLVRSIATWYAETDRFRRLASRDLGATAGAKGDHEELFRLVMDNEAAAAVTLLTRHIRDTSDRHLGYFDADLQPAI